MVSDEQQRERLNTGAKTISEAHRFDENALSAWMASNVPGFEGPLSVLQFRGGQSNPTYQLATPIQKYVLRRRPPGKLLPSAHAVDREFRIIAALHGTGFPVPRPYGVCLDDGVIGTWFYVMEMVEGRIFWDQTLPHCGPDERRAIILDKIRALADLHNTDYVRIGLEDYGKPGNYMARQIDRWTRQYRASETAHIPEIERLIGWLPGAVPSQERTTIVHGDYRLDNMIFHSDRAQVKAVLDWELSTLGEPLADFTNLLMNWVSGPLSEVADLRDLGIPTLEESIEHYCRLTDRGSLPSLNWYFAYNAFRSAGIAQGIVGRVRDGTAHHPEAAQKAERVAHLAKVGWAFAQKAGA